MNLGVETGWFNELDLWQFQFQHSLMNLGVETSATFDLPPYQVNVSAFSDESWGGDQVR